MPMTESLNVLVVDDEADVCWALKTLLQKHGFTVVTVVSGAQALWWLNEKDRACSLILVDAKLGDIEGVELARRIRTETSCAAPLILVSGYFYKDDGVVQDNLSSGLISSFVTKPFRHEEIMSAVRAVLSTTK
jgi:DNA-binding response OmpR family regulator